VPLVDVPVAALPVFEEDAVECDLLAELELELPVPGCTLLLAVPLCDCDCDEWWVDVVTLTVDEVLWLEVGTSEELYDDAEDDLLTECELELPDPEPTLVDDLLTERELELAVPVWMLLDAVLLEWDEAEDLFAEAEPVLELPVPVWTLVDVL